MGFLSPTLKSSLKMEEQEVPDTIVSKSSVSKTMDEIDIMDKMEDMWDEEHLLGDNMSGVFGNDFLDWDDFTIEEEDEEQLKDENEESGEGEMVSKKTKRSEWFEEQTCYNSFIKEEISSLWDDDEKNISMNLNLNLNYQEVMDAWSDRGSLWADDYSPLMINNYMGEVPVMQEDRKGREARVLRYKEKRQNRLFSKKIRYQVRKVNAEKRPRLKGRFVKRVLDKAHR
ncbi:hypothetical protein IFM89_012885 [Coptis chinensis]|uniref:CCT domain-containing protein n=1 Tax=Coptis chinensis TaxID=261450 RepID=A0A835HB74_9MAGN|nr:hypothetical protein IFM89_012885 [Coptis chinensis]